MIPAIAFADRTKILSEHPLIPFDPAPTIASAAVRTAVNDALDRGETHYTDRPGILPLRKAIAAALDTRFQITIDPQSEMIVTCGVTEARFVAIQQLLKPGDTLAAPAASDRIFGAALLRRIDLVQDIEPAATLVYLTSSTPEPELRLNLAAASDSALILFEVDDPDSRFHPSQLPGFEDRVVTIGDLGDQSWRIGYLASPSTLSSALRDFKQALTICSTNISQWAALAAMEQF